ncbi:MAG: hypothetical protein NT150_12730 [Bacteroidetes bacterium]|nr:hypothetical protein [Bacteroidota bacterium]
MKATLSVDASFTEATVSELLVMTKVADDSLKNTENFKNLSFHPYHNDSFPDEAQSFVFKLSISNNTPKDLELLIGTSLFDYITLYYLNASGTIATSKSGLKAPINKELSMGGNSYLPFVLPKGTHDVIIVARYDKKIENQYAPLPFTLYSKSRFESVKKSSDSSLHFFLGAIIIMTLYNLALFFVVRKKFYLYYILNNIVIMLFVLFVCVVLGWRT